MKILNIILFFLLHIYNNMNNKLNNNNYKINKNEIIVKYEIKKQDKKIKIFGNEFIKNNNKNFEFYINGINYIIRDEIDN